MTVAPHPSWQTAREACQVVVYRPHLAQTVPIALIVGVVLFAINQLDVVLAGHATLTTWVKVAVTFLVPFVVANVGVLVACHRLVTNKRQPVSPAVEESR